MLTEPQAKVLEFIVRYGRLNQMPPTRAEISKEFGWTSPNAANAVVKALARKGRVKISARTARGIFVLDSSGG